MKHIVLTLAAFTALTTSVLAQQQPYPPYSTGSTSNNPYPPEYQTTEIPNKDNQQPAPQPGHPLDPNDVAVLTGKAQAAQNSQQGPTVYYTYPMDNSTWYNGQWNNGNRGSFFRPGFGRAFGRGPFMNRSFGGSGFGNPGFGRPGSFFGGFNRGFGGGLGNNFETGFGGSRGFGFGGFNRTPVFINNQPGGTVNVFGTPNVVARPVHP